MTLILDLPPDTERRLLELAEDSRQGLAEFTLTLIQNQLQSRQTEGETEDLLAEAVARMARRTPEQVEQAQARAAHFIRPGKPLPPGQTLVDAVAGKWPGDESDEEVTEALRRLS